MKPATGLRMCSATKAAASSSAVPPISPIMITPSVAASSLNSSQDIDEVGPVDRIAADPDRRGLAKAETGQLIDRFVGQGARAGDHADPTGLMDVARHDPDPALLGG